MKKLILLIALIAGLFSVRAGAQSFGNPVTWTGTTNGTPFLTNTFYLFVPSKSAVIGGGTISTNQNFMLNIIGVFPSGTNYIVQTNAFSLGTKFGSFSTNPVGSTYPFTVVFYMVASNGPASGGLGVNWTNNIYAP